MEKYCVEIPGSSSKLIIFASSYSNPMKEKILEKAAAQFGKGLPIIERFGEGLIHRTYKVTYPDSEPVILQCINQHTFPQPENIINNYRLLYNYLLNHDSDIHIPEPVLTTQGKMYWIDAEENFWRATFFIPDSYSLILSKDQNEVFTAANYFARFTKSLNGLDTDQLYIVISGFHDLSLRYKQFEQAIQNAAIKRLLKSTHVIAELRQRKKLVEFYESIRNHPKYILRAMHHDCKISNILFNKDTNEPVCAVDLDTVMPGYYFSDIGDMIRTMACSVDENSTRWEQIDIRKDYYNAILNGYTTGIGELLTGEEHTHVHHAGIMMIYMQAVRFVSDFLNNDIYYHTTYPEQNLNRALNQFILLEKLEEFLEKEYKYAIYN